MPLAAFLAALSGPVVVGAESVGPRQDAVCPAATELEALGYRIGSIRIRELPIFDAGPDGELPAVYRLANELHVDTRDSVIESQLLFRKGDLVSHRLFEETERNLRELRYIREPSVTRRPLPGRRGRHRGHGTGSLDDQSRVSLSSAAAARTRPASSSRN